MAYNFPLKFNFKISTIANDFVMYDATDQVLAYVRQKMFKFIEQIEVFTDESRSQVKYTIKANKWLDFNTSYLFADPQGQQVGRVARKGWKSIWKAQYEVYNNNDQLEYVILEKNPWVKFWDSMIQQIPIAAMFTGYMFNPSYKIMDNNQVEVATLKKDKSFFGRKFSVEKHHDIPEGDEERIVLSLMMMILLERRRG